VEHPQGRKRGTVKKMLTERTEVGGQTAVAASEEDPRYLVESEKSGKEAVHKPDALSNGQVVWQRAPSRSWRSSARRNASSASALLGLHAWGIWPSSFRRGERSGPVQSRVR